LTYELVSLKCFPSLSSVHGIQLGLVVPDKAEVEDELAAADQLLVIIMPFLGERGGRACIKEWL